MQLELVPGRECGSCNVCCDQPLINAPEIRKLPGVLCSHWATGVGCSIYATRPGVCRGHLCGWRTLADFDDSWRPDLSKIYIQVNGVAHPEFRDQVPDAPVHVKITILGELEAGKLKELAAFCASLVRGGIPAFVTLAAPAGFVRRDFPLNTVLRRFVSADEATFLETFKMALVAAGQTPLTKIVFGTTDQPASAA